MAAKVGLSGLHSFLRNILLLVIPAGVACGPSKLDANAGAIEHGFTFQLAGGADGLQFSFGR
jgi:hypothetical protein